MIYDDNGDRKKMENVHKLYVVEYIYIFKDNRTYTQIVIIMIMNIVPVYLFVLFVSCQKSQELNMKIYINPEQMY